ncbi:MAG: YheC/YheD family protein [Ectobacillus sp.]
MEPIKDPFWIVLDKELTLQLLRTNNIPALELADAKTSSYPIIGRKYGYHEGKDIAIIHTKDQALDGEFDYFTKLYVIEKEYRIQIQGLSVIGIFEAKANEMVLDEIPIRTKTHGWEWKEADDGDVPEEWRQIAVRALYVTGLTHGFVKIGKTASDTVVVIDVEASARQISMPVAAPRQPFTIGADVEFMLSCDGELLPASDIFPLQGPIGCDERQIERDSSDYALAELRPEPAESPQELFNNIKNLISQASGQAPYGNIAFRAGSMPFSGYQCGGHIHFGVPLSLPLLRALDHYLAIPLAMIEDSHTSRRRRKTKHGGLGRYRIKPYGFEYLSLSSWIVEPDIALATLSLAHLVVAHHDELQSGFLFHPIVQRAYYQGNRIILKRFWEGIKKQLMDTSGYSSYERELLPLFERIEQETVLNEKADIRQNWGLAVPAQLYDRGLVIQIPKKTRLKFNLQDGQKTYVRAGNSISEATIRAHPFSFRNSAIVQLSPALRNALSLPQDWHPKIFSANNVITLGPIIGILAKRPFDRQSTYFQHLCRLAKDKQMLMYIFEPEDINWEQKVIKGTTLSGNGIFPFPSVIYDRYFHTKGVKKEFVDEIRVRLQAVYHIPFVNPPALFQLTGDKWLSHQVLSKELEEYLPDARLLERPSDITDMLDRYGEIFLKPVGGALSKGVIRVIRKPSGLFWMNSTHQTFQELGDIQELISMLFPLKKQHPYIVQEGIKRKRLKGRYVEIRVYMQKNSQQKWMRTGMVTRLTSEGVMTEDTEINRQVSKVIGKLYSNPAQQREIRDELAEVARRVVETVEEEVGAFGEIAVDLCIDQYNAIKIIEINAKPDSLFTQIKAFKLRNLAGIRLLNYAASLAGYEPGEI